MAERKPVTSGEGGAESPFPGPCLDMTCLNPGRAEISSPILTGPAAIPGIVLFLGAAIPGDIPPIGTVGTSLSSSKIGGLSQRRL